MSSAAEVEGRLPLTKTIVYKGGISLRCVGSGLNKINRDVGLRIR